MKSPQEQEEKDVPEFRVLVVEDNPQHQELLEFYFAEDNIGFDMAFDALEALERLSETAYSAILVDLGLPKMKGQDFIREVRRRYGPVKIIVISATDSYADLLDSYESGADYFISKPYRKDYVRVLVNRALENKEFFQKHWAAIREAWAESVPKQRLLTEKNIIEDTDDFIDNRIFTHRNTDRIGPLADRSQPFPQGTPARPDDKRQEHLAALLATVPDSGGYVEQAQSLDELLHGFRREMAARLQPVLNAHIQAMPHETHEEKKALARWVNEELRRFDLAIRCPKTGQPSLLFAGPGNHPEIGRFILEHRTPEGKRVRPVQTPELQHLELMEAAPRREAFVEMHQRIGPGRGGPTRG